MNWFNRSQNDITELRDVGDVDEIPFKDRMACVPYYRDNAFACWSSLDGIPEPVPMSLAAERHLDFICYDQIYQFGTKHFDLARDQNSIPAWSEFQHRNLIYQAIALPFILSGDSPSREIGEFVMHVNRELRRVIEEKVAASEPEKAEALLEHFGSENVSRSGKRRTGEER